MRDLDVLIKAARQAGVIAMNHFKSDPQVWDKGGAAGPVTEADLAVNDMLLKTLKMSRPSYGWLSEETEDNDLRLQSENVFIVDPIDGTRSFIEGAPNWGHSLAIAHNGQIITATVFMPVLDLIFTATEGGGAFVNGKRLQVAVRNDVKGADILATKQNFQEEFWPGGLPDIIRSFKSSLAYRLCLVAEGKFDGMLTLRPTWEWDVAAGCLILSEAGGLVTNRLGSKLQFNSPKAQLNGIVASNADVHRGLMIGLL